MTRLLPVVLVAALACGCSSTPVDPSTAPSAERRTAADPGTRTVTPARPATATRAPVTAGAARVIYFDYDRYTVRPEFESALQAHARFLREHPGSRVVVEGHTDERGGREYNLALGQRRSEAVRQALSMFGASSQQVEAVSFGEEKPVRRDGDETAWGANRRAEIRFR
jgi:peptidoglycan-associated lipoprotein